MAEKKGVKKEKGEVMTQEKIVGIFQKLRQEQRSIVSKIAELEGDGNEFKLVIGVLKEAEPQRKCFRLVGGVLVERTVKDVLPALELSHQQLGEALQTLHKQLEIKGKELSEFKDKFGIRFQGEEKDSDKDSKQEAEGKTQGVLVS